MSCNPSPLRPLAATMRSPAWIALPLSIGACASPLNVVAELSPTPSSTVEGRVQWGEPGSGFLPSTDKTMLVEPFPVVATRAGEWTMRSVPRTRELRFDLAEVRLTWAGDEPASVVVRLSDRAWADEGRRLHTVT
jgi:hypothetical protein